MLDTQLNSQTFKLEWIQAIRRTLWIFIKSYYEHRNVDQSDDFFLMEQKINSRVDVFLDEYFISYSKYKDSLLKQQKELVDKLSVPIIPINESISILPIIGSVDSYRAEIIEERVLSEVGISRIETLIMDLSGMANMESNVVIEIMKIIDSISLMGCKTVITGIRKEIVQDIAKSGITFDQAKTLATLKQALHEYIIQ
ncbi:STAS domain-containing protein [Tenuibacillus multivorans]|uniref:Anti-anti-sigma regulatory factor (Antagonist of anti-sigma factor) n=1 Tax=Tenuibacillus multivorans TaxID=237069 RepID=A0A1H0EX85_9BACI|nr:STAS domain-containing protein [Tenuibacillus multivorans]GEL76921.1 hypothetical protein TMU01_11560 [Tenuibacillus multivorans]SDN86955.1 Anti-anti-sigma regulatory factor (antagonist of anti-sigma factor) [Tenuibacillus multivorans]